MSSFRIYNVVRIKFGSDGTTNGKLKTTSITLVPLNISSFPSQARDSCFPISMWLGKESEFMQYLNHFNSDLKELVQNGIEVDGTHYTIEAFWVSDLQCNTW